MKKITVAVVFLFLASAAIAVAGQSGTWALRSFMDFTAPPALASKDPAPQVGDTHTFWVWDLSVMPPQDKQITATCRGVSDFGYVFIEDAQWNVSMDQSDVDTILEAWDEATPAGGIDPTKGIYDIETMVYGEPPNVDGWPGIVLLYYEIGCFMGSCFDGFYRYDDQLAGIHSNQMDMLHLEATQSDPGGEYMLGIAAHEFNHMLQMVHDLNEDPWLSESLAEAAMIVTGYDTDLDWLADFVTDPTVSFWGDSQSVHYGAALLLGTYLYEYGGIPLLTAINADDQQGAVSVEDQLLELELAPSFASLFGDMATAIAADRFVEEWSPPTPPENFSYNLLSVGELIWDEEIIAGQSPTTWSIALPAGSLNGLRIDIPAKFTALNLVLSGDSLNSLEFGVIQAGQGGGKVLVDRLNSGVAGWPNATIDLQVGAGEALQAVVVAANPTNGEITCSVEVSVDVGDDDDDTNDDDNDDDASDDDTVDDDDDATGDDNDDDSGCGC